MRFHVSLGTDEDLLNAANSAAGTAAVNAKAGFSFVGLPQMTVENVEYKEGIWVYSRKYPGNPSFNTVTMQRGVARGDSSFLNWILRVAEGSGEYRQDIIISQLSRDNNLFLRKDGTVESNNLLVNNIIDTTVGRQITLHEAFPISHKLGSDLDAKSSDVSIMEIEFAFEYISVKQGTIPDKGDLAQPA
jgi:phage tail-like protein